MVAAGQATSNSPNSHDPSSGQTKTIVHGHPSLTLNPTCTMSISAPCFNLPSPLSQQSPSPSITTPPEDFLQPFVSVAGDPPEPSTFDLNSVFMPYAAFMPYDEGAFSVLDLKDHSHNPSDYHCGCMDEHLHRNLLSELSHGLRKASNILACVPNHQLGLRCELQQRVHDLGTFATYAPSASLISRVLRSLPGSDALESSTRTSSEQVASPLVRGVRVGLSNIGLQTPTSPLTATPMESWGLTCCGPPSDSFTPWEHPPS